MNDDPSNRAGLKPLHWWLLAPLALSAIALCAARLRVVSPLFIYPEALIFCPAWLFGFFLLDDQDPSRPFLFVANLPYYYVLLSPMLGLASKRRGLRPAALAILVVAIVAHLVVGVFLARIAYVFTYGDHNFIPR